MSKRKAYPTSYPPVPPDSTYTYPTTHDYNPNSPAQVPSGPFAFHKPPPVFHNPSPFAQRPASGRSVPSAPVLSPADMANLSLSNTSESDVIYPRLDATKDLVRRTGGS